MAVLKKRLALATGIGGGDGNDFDTLGDQLFRMCFHHYKPGHPAESRMVPNPHSLIANIANSSQRYSYHQIPKRAHLLLLEEQKAIAEINGGWRQADLDDMRALLEKGAREKYYTVLDSVFKEFSGGVVFSEWAATLPITEGSEKIVSFAERQKAIVAKRLS